MRNKQKKVMMGLFGALGAVAAFFGVRALMSWMRERYSEPEYELAGRQAWQRAVAAAQPPAAGTSTQNYPQAEMPSGVQQPGMPQAGVTASARTEVGENYPESFQTESEPDQTAIPATGMLGAPAAEMPRTQERPQTYEQSQPQEPANMPGQSSMPGQARHMPGHTIDTGQQNLVETDQPVPVSSLVGPFIVHLLSFHNMMNVLKQRRAAANASDAAGDAAGGGPDVREGGADAVSSLAAQLPEFDRSMLVQNSLQGRMFQMMERIRDMLQNTSTSEDQLFHQSDELGPAACQILDLIHRAGEDNVTGFEDVKKAYSCK